MPRFAEAAAGWRPGAGSDAGRRRPCARPAGPSSSARERRSDSGDRTWALEELEIAGADGCDVADAADRGHHFLDDLVRQEERVAGVSHGEVAVAEYAQAERDGRADRV